VRKSHIVILIIVLGGAAVLLVPIFKPSWFDSLNGGAVAVGLAALICLAAFLKFEERRVSSKEIALVAMLGTTSAVLRVPFAAIPGVQPCTFLITCSGLVFGPMAGFVVGSMTPLVSNYFLGHGPWTLYQMVAWGLVGGASGYLGRIGVNRALLVILGIIWGYWYGLVTNLWFWTGFVYPLTLKTLLVTEMGSIWFDTLHAAGNAVFLGWLGIKTIAVLNRFKDRFSITV
jgi:energy-coupling factor transport system substrate-specific component